MEVRECSAEDVISLLHCASDDKDIKFIDNWKQYQKWILDAVYNKNYQVIVAAEDWGVIGFLVWQMYQSYGKWEGLLHYVYVSEDFRKTEVADKLIWQYIHNIYNSSAQQAKFNTMVLSQDWIDIITLNVPYDKYDTYTIPRTDELKEWFNSLKES